MKKFLILAIAIFTACILHAQTPETITVPKGPYTFNPNAADAACDNFAGTFVLGAKGVKTQSNDLALDTIWLCLNDSIFINHNGDFNLTGDPNPATQPGVGYSFYTCPPTATGPTLQNIMGQPFIAPVNGVGGQPFIPADPCLLNVPPPSNGLIYVASGTPDGDMWFFNSGGLQTTFNSGNPLLMHFAPITFDDANNNGYETTVNGGAPGECVHVNTAAQFEVVYLNAIEAIGFTTPYNGNSCLGRFRLSGGYPEWNLDAQYQVSIYLKNNPTVKALINNPNAQLKHNVSLIFSVPVSGTYVIEVEDGKSCGLRTEVDMTACVNSDNVGLIFPNVTAGPGETVCVPITTQNFTNVQGFSTSIQWDPAVLELLPTDFIQNINGDLIDFDPLGNTETSLVSQGYLGIANIGSTAATLSSTEVLMEVCFKVLAQVDGVCSPLSFTNEPSSVNASSSTGSFLAVEGTSGTMCVVYNPLVIDINPLPNTCGSLLTDYTISVTGEEPPYEIRYQQITPTVGPNFLITGVNPGELTNIPGLAAGEHRIIVTPQNGLGIAEADTVILTVVAPEQLGAALNLSNLPSCNGLNDGEVSVTVFLGTTAVTDLTGYTLVWSANATNPGQPVQSMVGAGLYSVQVTQNATGCTAVASGTLGNPAALDNKQPSITPASCSGIADGCFTYEMEGGTPFLGGFYAYDITYSETAAGTQSNFASFTGNPYSAGCTALAGFYTLTVTDANGCTYTDQIEVPALRTIELVQNLTTTQLPSCFGGCDGALGVSVIETPTPGTSSFFFSWTPGSTQITNTPTTSIIGNICAGEFFVSAVDAQGCSANLTLTLDNPAQFSVIPTVVNNPTCLSPNNGSISVLGQGGTGTPASFTYSWSTMGAGSSISGLSEGTYTVTASDAQGCTAVYDTTLALPAPPALSVTQIDVRCGSDGTLTAVAPTATSYAWSSLTGNQINMPNQAAISNLMGGTYVIKVTDANSCMNIDTIVLAAVAPLAIGNATVNDPSCFDYTDGSISIGVTGGNPSYTYQWNTPPPNTTPTVLALGSGTFTVTVTDSKNCTLVEDFTLTNPPQINIIATNENQTSCFGACDGTVTLLVNYPDNNNFNFIWDNGGSTDSVRVDLCSGTNTVTVTETSSAQCFRIFEVVTGSPTAVGVDLTETAIDSVSCYGLADGAVFLSSQGGNGGPFTYAWANGSTTSVINNLPAGPYAVTMTDKDGCTGTYTVVVPQPDPITISVDANLTQNLICFGDENGALGVSATGGNIPPLGVPPYTYAWSDGSNQIGVTNPIDMLKAGQYTVTVTDVKGCTGTASPVLTEPDRVFGQYEQGPALICHGDETTITVTNIVGGTPGGYSYTIDFGVPISPNLTSSITGGEHFITYIDQKNCEYTDTINIPEPPQITVEFTPAFFEIQLGEERELFPQINSLRPITSFVWEPAEFLKDPSVLDGAILYTFESGTLMLTVTDSFGCTGKGSLEVEVDLNRNIYIPNVFTPNTPLGDNQFFAPGGGIGVDRVNFMQVFDRWGNLMYEQKEFQPEATGVFNSGWDGRYRGKFVEPGVYVYAIEVLFVDGKKLLYRGDITVIR